MEERIYTLDTPTSQIVQQIQPTSPPPPPPPSSQENLKVFSFPDGKSIYVPYESIRTNDFLLNTTFINRSSELFTKFILPIVQKYSLETINFASRHEFKIFVDEIKFYGITLNRQEIIQVHRRVNLDKISFVIQLWLNKKLKKSLKGGDYHFKRREDASRFSMFIFYIKQHFMNYYSNEIPPITNIVKLLLNDSVNDLSMINWKFNNCIFEFCEFFKNYVIDGIEDRSNYFSINFNINISVPDTLNIWTIINDVSDEFNQIFRTL